MPSSQGEQWERARAAKIEAAISKDSELGAFFQMLNNQFFNFQAVRSFVDQWNKSHPEFSKQDLDSSVQKVYFGKQGSVITVWVSQDGKVRIMANYDERYDEGKKKA